MRLLTRVYGSSGQNKVNIRPVCNDRATVIPFSFRARLLCVVETFPNY